jgi:hypothetical protein
MVKKILIITLIFSVVAAVLFAHDITGKDIVNRGNMVVLDGTLQYESPDWYLYTEDVSYLLHFGNREYQETTGIVLEDGIRCEIKGVVEGSDIAVISATIDGKSYAFRNDDGTPLWAGRGRRLSMNKSRECMDDARRLCRYGRGYNRYGSSGYQKRGN